MMGKLGEVVKGDTFVLVLICIILIAYFVYKEWPEFKKRVTKSTVDQKDAEAKDLSVSQRLDALQKTAEGQTDYDVVVLVVRGVTPFAGMEDHIREHFYDWCADAEAICL